MVFNNAQNTGTGLVSSLRPIIHAREMRGSVQVCNLPETTSTSKQTGQQSNDWLEGRELFRLIDVATC